MPGNAVMVSYQPYPYGDMAVKKSVGSFSPFIYDTISSWRYLNFTNYELQMWFAFPSNLIHIYHVKMWLYIFVNTNVSLCHLILIIQKNDEM